jgi:hypothetical protein
MDSFSITVTRAEAVWPRVNFVARKFLGTWPFETAKLERKREAASAPPCCEGRERSQITTSHELWPLASLTYQPLRYTAKYECISESARNENQAQLAVKINTAAAFESLLQATRIRRVTLCDSKGICN